VADAVETPGGGLLTQKLAVLTGELRYAWDRSSQADLQRWSQQTVADFATVLSRRVSNFFNLLLKVGTRTLLEVREVFMLATL